MPRTWVLKLKNTCKHTSIQLLSEGAISMLTAIKIEILELYLRITFL